MRFENPIPYQYKQGIVTSVKFQAGKPPDVEVRVVNRRPEGEFVDRVGLWGNSNIELLYELVRHSGALFEPGAFKLCILTGPESKKTVLKEYSGKGKKKLAHYGLEEGGAVFVMY